MPVKASKVAVPGQVDLLRHTDAMKVFHLVREQRGWSVSEVCKRANLTRNSFQGWLRNDRSPSLAKFTSFATVHGYEVALLDGQGQATSFRDQRACIDRIDLKRKRAGVGIYDMECMSGISVRTFYAWRNGDRNPTLFNIVALAMSLGTQVVMRRMA